MPSLKLLPAGLILLGSLAVSCQLTQTPLPTATEILQPGEVRPSPSRP